MRLPAADADDTSRDPSSIAMSTVLFENVRRRRRSVLVVPPPAMDTRKESSTANAGGSSSLDASVVPASSLIMPAADGRGEATVAPTKDFEKERQRKGKMLVTDQSQPSAKQQLADHHHASIQPDPVEKLMGGAIRAHRQQSNTQSHLENTPPPPFTAVKNVAFEDVAISDRLRAVLDDLGVVSPVCVYEKGMWASDRSVEQNRLLISYKGNSRRSRKRKKLSDQDLKAVNFATMFSEKERPLVHPPEDGNQDGNNKRRSEQPEEEDGERDEGRPEQQEEEDEEEEEEMKKKKKDVCLDVRAYDRNGVPYHVKCKFLGCNNAYRIIGMDWRVFLDKNGLVVPENEKPKRKKPSPEPNYGGPPKRKNKSGSASPSPEPDGDADRPNHVRIELWAFRSPKLELGCTDQPGGALGLILLHYSEGGAQPQRVDHIGRAAAGAMELPQGSQQNRAATANVDEMAMADAGGALGEAGALLQGDLTPDFWGAVVGLMLLKQGHWGDSDKGSKEDGGGN